MEYQYRSTASRKRDITVVQADLSGAKQSLYFFWKMTDKEHHYVHRQFMSIPFGYTLLLLANDSAVLQYFKI